MFPHSLSALCYTHNKIYLKFMSENNSKFQSYFCNGLVINSEIPLPDFLVTELKSNVTLRFGKVTKSEFYNKFMRHQIFQRTGFVMRAGKNIFCIEWVGIGFCSIRNGSEVIIELNPDTEKKDVVPLITTQVLAILLHQNGNLVLHASSVLMNGAAVAFLGEKGYGKSTLAAHLQIRGHQLISDDLVPTKFCGGEIKTVPGFSRLKLLPDSISSIGLNPESVPKVHHLVPKHLYKSPDDAMTEPVKLGCIFVLNVDSETNIKKMSPASAFIEITRHTYLNRFIGAMENTADHFNDCQTIIKSIPVFELNRPHDYSQMQKVITLLEDHASSLN